MWLNRQLSIAFASAVVVLATTPARAVTTVTDVRLEPRSDGIEVILATLNGELRQERSDRIFPTSFGSTYVVNIVNSQLRLRNQGFRAENPVAGIASVTVTQQGAGSIRVTVTGTKALPAVKVTQSEKGLVLNLTAPTAPTAQKPTPTPAPPDSQPVEPTAPEIQPSPEIEPTAPTAEKPQPEAGEGEEQKKLS